MRNKKTLIITMAALVGVLGVSTVYTYNSVMPKENKNMINKEISSKETVSKATQEPIIEEAKVDPPTEQKAPAAVNNQALEQQTTHMHGWNDTQWACMQKIVYSLPNMFTPEQGDRGYNAFHNIELWMQSRGVQWDICSLYDQLIVPLDLGDKQWLSKIVPNSVMQMLLNADHESYIYYRSNFQ